MRKEPDAAYAVACHILGNSYNPHNPMLEHDFYPILKLAYTYEKCDLQTVPLYFESYPILYGGKQHHFPESCGITKEEFENLSHTLDYITP